MLNTEKTMEKIVNLCKNRGFLFPGSEIYGGLSNTWDYGPLGSELKNNIKNFWIKKFVHMNKLNVLIDSSILLNPSVWVSSGHVGGFSDPLMDCKVCKTRHRADKLIEEKDFDPTSMNFENMENFIKEKNIVCPDCGAKDFTNIRSFNLMFKTYLGVTEDSKNEVYLRPETAQGIFINFLNVARASRKKVPFGIAQIGKSFRNEITPGNFIFRTREFEQMELEFFCKPGTDLKWFDYWKNFCKEFVLSLGLKKENIKLRDHSKEELSHYSLATTDIEFLFPFGWGELLGIADRTDFDLKAHQDGSNKNLEYFDAEENKHYIPYVIEPSIGVDRLLLAVLCDAFDEEKIDQKDSRTVLRLQPALAPFKAAIFPLSKKLSGKALEVFDLLSKNFLVDFDESGSIGKRYRRQDEIGTPFCITYDFDSQTDNCVTIRDRDSMNQKRIPVKDLCSYLKSKINI